MKTRDLILLVLAVLPLAGCKREQHAYRVAPSLAIQAQDAQVGQLQAGPGGGPQPPVHNEYEENAYAISEGKRLYSAMNCVGCHAHGGGGMGPPLMDAKWIYGFQPEQIFATIVQGRPNGMPSYRGHLADYQVWQLVAYVRSLSGLAAPLATGGRGDEMRGPKPENSAPPQTPVQSQAPGGIEKL